MKERSNQQAKHGRRISGNYQNEGDYLIGKESLVQSHKGSMLIKAMENESVERSRMTDLSYAGGFNKNKLNDKSKSSIIGNSSLLLQGIGSSQSRQTRGNGSNHGSKNLDSSVYFSPQRSVQSDAGLYRKLKDGKFSYDQTRQILLSRHQQLANKKQSQKGKFSPSRDPNLPRDQNQMQKLSNSNSKYLSVPHGIPEHLKNRTSDVRTDRNKVYAKRSEDPMIMPTQITDIPAQLSLRYNQINDNEIIYESELMKYKPGIKHQYMSRWCQLTKSHFIYYAEGVPYASFLARPLAVIPMDAIESVKRVYVEVPEKDENNGETRWTQNYGATTSSDGDDRAYTSPLKLAQINKSAAKYQIVEVEEENESLNNSRGKYDVKIDVIESSGDKRVNRSNSNKFKDFENHSPIRNRLEVPGSQDQADRSQQSHSRNRSQSHFTPSKKLLENTAAQTQQGRHLMPKPSPRKLSKAREMSESPDRSMSRSPSVQKQDQSTVLREKRKISQKILKEIEKHIQDKAHRQHLIGLIEESLSKPLEIEEMIVRNPSSWIKSLSSNFTWTNRELEWYFAEDRFLFAAKNEEECDRWVCIMNWILAYEEDQTRNNQDQNTEEEVDVQETNVVEAFQYHKGNPKFYKLKSVESDFDNSSVERQQKQRPNVINNKMSHKNSLIKEE
ncbi:UNKNOWN [Stylonychia lemnae]|uniref:PH domain-containing protein n=1 Tax=Stylonychia lemnae TaxID=5949 RepID=A0A078ALF9_STYLE|nr:UNKNOWN [Stylonychia lemnae]|eukprot:CDW83195.1 UNKNOWN [Stylonychia lemnae]